ncbi:MAG: AmmeMemoRadiSam system radical SAM enzyme [Candidatus Omnitrophica bacterium]|nr:AmmeMemoRadiSam system radical SAM enzyme [Candidatus Omnitrophota bacterium]
MMKSNARFWHILEGEKIQCDLCPRQCILLSDQKGYCGVRENHHGQLMSLVYGKTSGFCIDPIEKKPLYHFYPGTGVLSFGTGGCNLGCIFCQNWRITKIKDLSFLTEHATPEKIVQAAKNYNCKSIAFTYNEPVIFAEYVIDTARLCRENGIKTIVVTSGYITSHAQPEFFEFIDAANVDLKGFSDRFYKDLVQAKLQPFLDTLLYIKKHTKIWLEITNLLIPGENDDPKEIDQMTLWIRNNLGDDVPLHFSAFFPSYKLLDKPATPPETLIRAREIALTNGLKYVYTGNVAHRTGSITSCHKCQTALIEREWFEIKNFNLINGCCPKCNTPCAGFFDAEQGLWGDKREPVNI